MKIAVWYHCILSGGSIPVDTACAAAIMDEQMYALKRSSLLDSCDEFHVGINGGQADAQIARLFVRSYKANLIPHGEGSTSEIPTMMKLREWLPNHPDYYVCYHHIKGITHHDCEPFATRRRDIEQAVIWGWIPCVEALGRGFDSCGAHWITPEKYPGWAPVPFWGGTFWWATSKYLMTLPPLPEPTWSNRFLAEHWIGKGPRRPRVKDFLPGFPK